MCLFCWSRCFMFSAQMVPHIRRTTGRTWGVETELTSPVHLRYPALIAPSLDYWRTDAWFNPTCHAAAPLAHEATAKTTLFYAVISFSSSWRIVSHILASFPVARMQSGSKMEGVILSYSCGSVEPTAAFKPKGSQRRDSLGRCIT